MNQSALSVALTLTVAFAASAAGCGSQLTDGRYAGEPNAGAATQPPTTTTATGTTGTTGSTGTTKPDPTTDPTSTAPITKAPVTCDTNDITPAYLVAHYTSSFLPLQRLIIATGTPGSASAPVNQIVLDNFVNSIGSLPAGGTATVTLSADNSLPSKCGLCIAASRGTDFVGPYKVLSGSIDVSTPSGQGTVMAVTFHNLVLEMKSGSTTTHWCIDQVTASTSTRTWSCADIGASSQTACWMSPDGLNAAALVCPSSSSSNQPQTFGCSSLSAVCGSSVANNRSIKSVCN